MLPREKGRHSRSITVSELTRGVVPKLVRQHILLILILRISDPGAPNSSWRKLLKAFDLIAPVASFLSSFVFLRTMHWRTSFFFLVPKITPPLWQKVKRN